MCFKGCICQLSFFGNNFCKHCVLAFKASFLKVIRVTEHKPAQKPNRNNQTAGS